MSRFSIFAICVTLNLLVGNSILFFVPNSPNYFLMIGMSIACVICYAVLFYFIFVERRSVPVILLLSILTCIIIELIGCFIASTLTSIEKIVSIEDFVVDILVGIVMGILGNMLMFPLTLAMGLANFFLLLFYRNKVTSSSRTDLFRN